MTESFTRSEIVFWFVWNDVDRHGLYFTWSDKNMYASGCKHVCEQHRLNIGHSHPFSLFRPHSDSAVPYSCCQTIPFDWNLMSLSYRPVLDVSFGSAGGAIREGTFCTPVEYFIGSLSACHLVFGRIEVTLAAHTMRLLISADWQTILLLTNAAVLCVRAIICSTVSG